MSGGSRKKKKKSVSEAEQEVEQLLRAAEDHLLLNLKTNSRTKSSSITPTNTLPSSSLDPDLDRRFQALKSNPRKSPSSSDADDLAARFTALKSSLGHQEHLPIGSSNVEESDDDDEVDGDGVSKKEVERLMEWAKDAARLEPSSKTDDEAEDDDEEDWEEEEERKKKEKKEGSSKGKGKPKKWEKKGKFYR